MVQEVLYFDGSSYTGEMGIEEETNLAYKEGAGRLRRGSANLSYF